MVPRRLPFSSKKRKKIESLLFGECLILFEKQNLKITAGCCWNDVIPKLIIFDRMANKIVGFLSISRLLEGISAAIS